MASTEVLSVAILVIVVGVLALRVLLWRLLEAMTTGIPRFKSRVTRSPIWAQSLRSRSRFQARFPKLDAFLARRLCPKPFTALPLSLMIVAALFTVALLSGLIDDLRETEGIVMLDSGINAFFTSYRVSWLLAVFEWITALAAGPATTAVAITASILLWSMRRRSQIGPLWITLLGAEATTWATKYVIARARPNFLHDITEASPSFPSGHATAATALIGFIAYIAVRDLPPRSRFDVTFWSVLLIALVCFSRIFLSLHYLSDVLAGVLVGSFWLLVGFVFAEWKRLP